VAIVKTDIVMTKHATKRWALRFALHDVDDEIKTARRLGARALKKLNITPTPGKVYLQTQCGAILVCRPQKTVAVTVLSPEYAALDVDGQHKKRRKRMG